MLGVPFICSRGASYSRELLLRTSLLSSLTGLLPRYATYHHPFFLLLTNKCRVTREFKRAARMEQATAINLNADSDLVILRTFLCIRPSPLYMSSHSRLRKAGTCHAPPLALQEEPGPVIAPALDLG